MALALQNLATSPSLISSLTQSKPSSFDFVTISDPRDIRDKKTQRTIRSNAGRIGARKRAKKARPPTWTFGLTGPSPSTGTSNSAADFALVFTPTRSKATSEGSTESEGFKVDQTFTTAMTNPMAVSNPTHLNVSNIDMWQPFGVDMNISPLYGYTIPDDERSRLLFDFFLDYKSRFAYPFMAMCINFALHDRAIISCILATASVLYQQKVDRRVGSSGAESASYKDSGLQMINSRLRSNVRNTSNETVCAVLAVACGEIFEENFDRWDMHFSGLKQIVDARGGLESLSLVDQLRGALLLGDMNGGLALDAAPHFDMSSYLPMKHCGQTGSPVLGTLLRTLRSSYDAFSDICDALISVANLSNDIEAYCREDGFFLNDNVRTVKFFPVLYQVLRLRRPDEVNDETPNAWEVAREATRLCLLLYVALLKECFFIAPNCIKRRREALSQFIFSNRLDVAVTPELWLWVYTVLAISTLSYDPGNDIDEAVAGVLDMMALMGIRSWGEATNLLHGIAWTNQLQAGGLSILGLKVGESGNNNSTFAFA